MVVKVPHSSIQKSRCIIVRRERPYLMSTIEIIHNEIRRQKFPMSA